MAGAAGRCCGNAGALRTGSGGKGCRGPDGGAPEGVRFPVSGAIGRAGTDTFRLATPGPCGCVGGASGGCNAPPADIGGRSGRNGFGFSGSAAAGGAAGALGAPGPGAAAAVEACAFSAGRTGTRKGGCNATGAGRGGSGAAAGAGRASFRSGCAGGSATATDVSVMCSAFSCSPLPSV